MKHFEGQIETPSLSAEDIKLKEQVIGFIDLIDADEDLHTIVGILKQCSIEINEEIKDSEKLKGEILEAVKKAITKDIIHLLHEKLGEKFSFGESEDDDSTEENADWHEEKGEE